MEEINFKALYDKNKNILKKSNKNILKKNKNKKIT